MVSYFVRSSRRLPSELEEAHVRAVYGVFSYSGDQASMIIDVAESIINVMKKVEASILAAKNGIVTRLRILSTWREYVKMVYEAVKRVKADAKVYLIGGAAEGGLTINSDIDVLIVLPHT